MNTHFHGITVNSYFSNLIKIEKSPPSDYKLPKFDNVPEEDWADGLEELPVMT